MFVMKNDKCDFAFFIQGDVIKNTQRYKNIAMHFLGYLRVKGLINAKMMERIEIMNAHQTKLHTATRIRNKNQENRKQQSGSTNFYFVLRTVHFQ